MPDIKDCHVAITGAGTGIGAAIASEFNQYKSRITLLGRREKPLLEQRDKCDNAQVIQCDISCEAQVTSAFKKAKNTYGDIDILINNAGQALSTAFQKTSSRQWQHMLDVNLSSVFYCSQNVYSSMCANGWGRIINIASTAALKGYEYVSAYCAAKHGVIGITRALALEAATTGVTVNAICPGFTDTTIVARTINTICQTTGRTEKQALEELIKYNPQQRLINTSEVANTVLWLCQPGSEAITGQSLAVAGGEIM